MGILKESMHKNVQRLPKQNFVDSTSKYQPRFSHATRIWFVLILFAFLLYEGKS
jgi:hypothetical protein